MHEYLTNRVTDLVFENALLRLRCQDLLDIIEGYQRFGSLGRFDADKIENTKVYLTEIQASKQAQAILAKQERADA